MGTYKYISRQITQTIAWNDMEGATNSPNWIPPSKPNSNFKAHGAFASSKQILKKGVRDKEKVLWTIEEKDEERLRVEETSA